MESKPRRPILPWKPHKRHEDGAENVRPEQNKQHARLCPLKNTPLLICDGMCVCVCVCACPIIKTNSSSRGVFLVIYKACWAEEKIWDITEGTMQQQRVYKKGAAIAKRHAPHVRVHD